MEDILYILIGIAWIGFSIYAQQRKLKKKQEEARKRRATDDYQEDESPEREEPSLFDKLFEDYEQEPEYEPEAETIRQPEPVAEKPRPAYYGSVERAGSRAAMVESNSKLSADYYNLGKDITKDQKKEEKQQDTSRTYDFGYEEQDAVHFDLRKAVIYSAILERPYD